MALSVKNTTPRKVAFADQAGIKSCASCSAGFSIVCLKHTCRKCNKVYCGKCSKSHVNAISNVLYRERLCLTCINLPLKSAEKSSMISTFTPSKLKFLDEVNGKNDFHLWSADTETDSDTSSDVGSDQKREFVKENLPRRIADDVIISNHNHAESKLGIAIKIPVSTPRESCNGAKISSSSASRERMLRKLCDASFSDTQSAASSVSSRASIISRKSPVANGQCFHCNVDFSNHCRRRHFCSHCYRVTCGTCSTTQVTTINNTIHRTRVCALCVRPPAETEFTPGKLHLLDNECGNSGGSQGRRNITSRLWSADTETDNDDSKDGSALFINNSLSENLTNAIQSEGEVDTLLDQRQQSKMFAATGSCEVAVLESCTSNIVELTATTKQTAHLSVKQKPHTESTDALVMSGVVQQRRTHLATVLVVASLLMLILCTVLPQIHLGIRSAPTYLLDVHDHFQHPINLFHPSDDGSAIQAPSSADQHDASEGGTEISEFLTQTHEPAESSCGSSIVVSADTFTHSQLEVTPGAPNPLSSASSTTTALQPTSPAAANKTTLHIVSVQYTMNLRRIFEGVKRLLSRLADTLSWSLRWYRRPQRS